MFIIKSIITKYFTEVSEIVIEQLESCYTWYYNNN